MSTHRPCPQWALGARLLLVCTVIRDRNLNWPGRIRTLLHLSRGGGVVKVGPALGVT
jgi:hypothetical protein